MIRRPPRSTLFPYNDALPISGCVAVGGAGESEVPAEGGCGVLRSEEHTSELQSQSNLVCRLLLEKKKKKQIVVTIHISRDCHARQSPHRYTRERDVRNQCQTR